MRTLRYEPIRHGDQKQDPRAGTAEKAPTHHTRSWPFAHFGTVVAYKAKRAECRNLLAQAYANTTLEQLTSVVPLYVLEDIAEQMQLAEQLFTPFREMPIEERVCAASCRPDRSGSCSGPAAAAAPRGTRGTAALCRCGEQVIEACRIGFQRPWSGRTRQTTGHHSPQAARRRSSATGLLRP